MSLNQTIEGRRRYRVLDLIGRGGSGSVYRARLEGPDGFTKDVALKVVRNSAVSDGELARFRDEARILGLVHDRAIVAVDPPIRLGERWAIVMEYVEGISAQRLVGLGQVPPRVALEIVGEVARVLHKIYAQLGPDGEPLHLVHRDLKPGNLQITPEGDVKLLDFGVASAEFQSRETVTLHTIAGTLGYIAPERLRGIEGPAGDVYSLGVLLHVLVTSERAVDLEASPETPWPTEIAQVVALAGRMRDPLPARRPTAVEVQRECAALAALGSGPTLRAWASETVPATVPYEPDSLVGSTLTETVEITARGQYLTSEPASVRLPDRAPSTRRSGWIAPMAVLAAVGAGVVGLPAIGMIALQLGTRTGTPEAAPVVAAVVTAAPSAEPVLPKAAIGFPEPTKPIDPVPVMAPAPASSPAPANASPRPRPVPTPAPAAVMAAPEPTPAPESIAMAVLTFESDPPGAMISLDGVVVGRTPLRGHPVTYGAYELKLERGDQSLVRTIRVGRRGSTRFSWQGDDLVAW